MLLLLIAVLLATLPIIGLCYVWMKSSRESQRRMEQQHARMVQLLEEQNELLRKSEQPGEKLGS